MSTTKIFLINIPFIIICYLFVSGCKKSESVTNPPESVQPTFLVPLSIGNQWTFIHTKYEDTLGTVSKVDTVRYFIQKDSILYGKKWFLESYQQVLLKNDDEGLWQYWSEPIIAYRYPIAKGTVFSKYGTQATVLSTDTLISTPIGQFHCYHFQTNYYGLLVNDFIAPGHGYIHLEYIGMWFGGGNSKPIIEYKFDIISATVK